jgi:hypothetical protein
MHALLLHARAHAHAQGRLWYTMGNKGMRHIHFKAYERARLEHKHFLRIHESTRKNTCTFPDTCSIAMCAYGGHIHSLSRAICKKRRKNIK